MSLGSKAYWLGATPVEHTVDRPWRMRYHSSSCGWNSMLLLLLLLLLVGVERHCGIILVMQRPGSRRREIVSGLRLLLLPLIARSRNTVLVQPETERTMNWASRMRSHLFMRVIVRRRFSSSELWLRMWLLQDG